jgi:hypothetical protein
VAILSIALLSSPVVQPFALLHANFALNLRSQSLPK